VAEVVLVTPFLRQMYSGMVPGLVAGHYQADACAIPLAPLARAAGVRLIEGAAAGLDAALRRVPLQDGGGLDYDLLSLDTGAVMDRDRLHGAREHALFVRPIEHFVAGLEDLLQRAAQRALDIAVIGGGAAGVELARGLANYSAAEARLIARKPSSQIGTLLGYANEAEMIHRDNLVLL